MAIHVSPAPHRKVRWDPQVNTGDSISCTNLSICTSKATVTSRSALGAVRTGASGVDLTHKMYKRFDACS